MLNTIRLYSRWGKHICCPYHYIQTFFVYTRLDFHNTTPQNLTLKIKTVISLLYTTNRSVLNARNQTNNEKSHLENFWYHQQRNIIRTCLCMSLVINSHTSDYHPQYSSGYYLWHWNMSGTGSIPSHDTKVNSSFQGR